MIGLDLTMFFYYVSCALQIPIVRTYYQVTFGAESLLPSQYSLSAVECLTWLTHFVYVLALRHCFGPSLRGPWLVLLLWLAQFAVQCLR